MIEGLHPYAEYKESGLPWLAAMPSHWRTGRNGNLFQQRNDTGYLQRVRDDFAVRPIENQNTRA